MKGKGKKVKGKVGLANALFPFPFFLLPVSEANYV